MSASKNTDSLLAIGVMTGNSLDGADSVLTEFSPDGTIIDLCSHFKSSPTVLTEQLRELRKLVNVLKGDVEAAACEFDLAIVSAAKSPATKEHYPDFEHLADAYTNFVADTIAELLAKARQDTIVNATYDLSSIDIVGFHGQTCAHLPPSIAKSRDKKDVYTVQLGNGQALADVTGITVAYDFRSDDLMLGGEAAPLAPMHHRHLANNLKRKGIFPLAFLNGGNSGNISLISEDSSGKEIFLGWDSGPCNAFPDRLTQLERGMSCDTDGLIGSKGSVKEELLAALFSRSVITKDGDNFLLKPAPKSSDPEWYELPPELLSGKSASGSPNTFEDRLRTVEYFAAYCFFHSLSLLPEQIPLPSHFLLCGGAWRNPVIKAHLSQLIAGNFIDNPVLPAHLEAFKRMAARIGSRGKTYCEISDSFGISAASMEARVFADAAVCRLKGEPFTVPEQTGVNSPCVLGVIRFPGEDPLRATTKVQNLLGQTLQTSPSTIRSVNPHWNRATAGWANR